MTNREATVEGRIYSPRPMNPNSVVYPTYNPNVITIERGAFGSQRKLDPNADNSRFWDKGKKL